MSNSSAGQASGLQVAFLIFAVLLLAAPLDKYVFQQWQWARDADAPLSRLAIFTFAAAILFLTPSLRRLSLQLLSAPIPGAKAKEIAGVIVLDAVMLLGVIGAFALYWWSSGGEPALARRMGGRLNGVDPWVQALTMKDFVFFFLIGGILGPIVEELVFRGILYPAWKARWGWLASAVATSLVFALCHPQSSGISQFLGSLVLICLLRRSGSLRACIVVHAASNISLWYPLLGQFLLPSGRETGELAAWTFHLICLAVICVALPVYMWMARDRNVEPLTPAPQGASSRL